jgi:hypothetical protein
MATRKTPLWVRAADPCSLLFHAIAYVGGGGIVVYQAARWILHTTFDYLPLDWALRQTQLHALNPDVWYAAITNLWAPAVPYVRLFLEWMPLSMCIFIIGLYIGGRIDTAAMDWEREHAMDDQLPPAPHHR